MRKFFLTIGMLIVLTLFATADFYINDLKPKIPTKPLQIVVVDERVDEVMAKDIQEEVNSLFKISQAIGRYKVIEQGPTKQLFDKIDISALKKIQSYKNTLESIEKKSDPITLYEIHGPKDQGSFTYLSVKLQFIAQIDAVTETLNESDEYGQKSFYFNDSNHPGTAFILTQIEDNLFGFQYRKDSNETFVAVKEIIETLISSF